MQIISILKLSLLLPFYFIGSGIFDYAVPQINNSTIALSTLQGKKLLIITLPLQRTPTADSALYALDTLATAHAADVKVIAVPAFEDGFTASQKNNLRQWYRSKLGNHIIITDGLYTRKTSGSQQHALFKWLTDSNQNNAFDIDVSGPGFKFFVRANGELYAVLRPKTKIWGPSVNRTLNMQ